MVSARTDEIGIAFTNIEQRDLAILDRDVVGVDVEASGQVDAADHGAVGPDLGGVGAALPGWPG